MCLYWFVIKTSTFTLGIAKEGFGPYWYPTLHAHINKGVSGHVEKSRQIVDDYCGIWKPTGKIHAMQYHFNSRNIWKYFSINALI